ncbi:melanoma-associated antigen 10-like [Perognathus longimembris pacificus]|uniref:melanoma-associated antigen 10-like n=1 Tax=Perognathus longimembris pacificus TaxID=214514 RepID=UPI002018F242|nr:melanoma-associated antigen 10-like [Perognathus longimembris pacificus]
MRVEEDTGSPPTKGIGFRTPKSHHCILYHTGTTGGMESGGLPSLPYFSHTSFNISALANYGSHSTAGSSVGHKSRKRRKRSSSTEEDSSDSESSPSSEIDEKVNDLVYFLLLKYQTKELVTRAEIVERVMKNFQGSFTLVLNEAIECLQLVFGLDLNEVDPINHTYDLVTALGITYDGMEAEVHGVPKTGLLIFILSLIFIDDKCVPEEEIWKVLGMIGVRPDSYHHIYGNPGKLILEEFVQEQYIEYRQVPNSFPPCYEFLWGPRVLAESTLMKFLQFLSSLIGSEPSSFPIWYEEALRDEIERAQARPPETDASAIGIAVAPDIYNLESISGYYPTEGQAGARNTV